MREKEWAWVEVAEAHGYPFHGVLEEALGLAAEFTRTYRQRFEVVSETREMLRVIVEHIEREKRGVVNDVVKV